MKRRNKIKKAAGIIRSILSGTGEWGSCAFIGLAFDAARTLDKVHCELAKGYRPGLCADAEWLEIDVWRRNRLRKLSPDTLHFIIDVSYRTGKLREAFDAIKYANRI